MTKPVAFTKLKTVPTMTDGDIDSLLEQFGDLCGDLAAARRRRFWMLLRVLAGVAFLAALFWMALQYRPAAAQSVPVPALKPAVASEVVAYGAVMAEVFRCAPGTPIQSRDALAEELRAKYGERHERTVYVMPTAVAELYIDRNDGSWTIIRTGPQKQACIALVGNRRFAPEQVAL